MKKSSASEFLYKAKHPPLVSNRNNRASDEKIRQTIKHIVDVDSGRPLTRIGFVSRYFQSDHPAGALIHGLVPLLSRAGFEVLVFHIDGSTNQSSWDAVKKSIAQHAHVIGYLPLNIGDCSAVLRSADLDILVYPEVGMDPVTYFLSYARLAPVQVAWMGHPDTTGVATIDYYLSSDVEVPSASKHYTEDLYKFQNLGTVLIDIYQPHATSQHSSPRTSLLERARLVEQLGLPRAAHMYIIPQPLYRLHGDFDQVLSKILLQVLN